MGKVDDIECAEVGPRIPTVGVDRKSNIRFVKCTKSIGLKDQGRVLSLCAKFDYDKSKLCQVHFLLVAVPPNSIDSGS